MEVAPVGVEDDLGVDGAASGSGVAARTFLNGKRGVVLGVLFTRLLGINRDEKSEGGDGSSYARKPNE